MGRASACRFRSLRLAAFDRPIKTHKMLARLLSQAFVGETTYLGCVNCRLLTEVSVTVSAWVCVTEFTISRADCDPCNVRVLSMVKASADQIKTRHSYSCEILAVDF